MPRKRTLLILALLPVLLGLGAVFFLLGKPPAPPPLPNPNGYDDLLAGAKLLPKIPPGYLKLPADQLRPFVAGCSNGFARARLGFDRECQVPVPVSREALGSHMSELELARNLAQSLGAAGRLAELEGRTAEAAQLYYESMLAGERAGRGMIIDAVMGRATMRHGVIALTQLLRHLDAGQCRKLARELERMEREAEPAARAVEREKDWISSQGFTAKVAALFTQTQLQRVYDDFTAKADQQTTAQRRLMLDLATRACKLEHGKQPSDHSALVPEYLRAIPVDAETGGKLPIREP